MSDMVNAAIDYNLSWKYDDKTHGFILEAFRDINIGEEMTITYG